MITPIEENQIQTGWLNRNVIGMALASFFSDAGHEAVTAVLPLFLASIGAPAAALGAIEGVADAVSSFVKLGAGWFSDRIGRRKPIAVFGYVLTGLSTGLFGLATAWLQVLLIRAIGWFGRGIRGPVRDAMLADSVPAQARGRAFGFHRAGDTLGAIAGPLLALALISSYTGGQAVEIRYREIFLISVIPGLLSALLFALLVREIRRNGQNAGLFQSIRELPRSFYYYLIGVGIFGAGDFAHSLLTLHAAQLLSPAFGVARAGQLAVGLYLVHNFFYAAMSYPIGALADRIGKRGLLAAGYGLAAVMSLGWILATPSPGFLGVLFALGGTFIAAEDSLEGALAADLLPGKARGTGFGILSSINGLGDFLSSLIVGLLFTTIDPAAGFIYAAILSLTGAVVIYVLR
jgi:MFS family permease